MRGLSISEISQRRGLSTTTIVSHLERLIAGGEALPLERDLPPPERVTRITEAFAQTESRNLTPVKDLLGDDYSYDELRLVRAWLDQQRHLSAADPEQSAEPPS